MARGELARRLTVIEARRCLGLWVFRGQAEETQTPLAAVVAKIGLVTWLLFLFLAVALSHGKWLHWGYPTGRMLVSWAIWGLGGALPIVGVLLTALATVSPTQATNLGRPVVTFMRLLPIPERAALRAKTSGATFAYLVWLAAGMLALAVARSLMIGWDLVETLPSLLDPWAVASTLAFGCVLLRGLQADVVTRRHGPATQTFFDVFAIIYALALGAAVAGLGFMPSGSWAIAAYALLLAFGVAAATATMLLRSKARRRRPPTQTRDKPRQRSPWWNDVPVRADALPGLSIAWAPSWRPTSRERLVQTTSFAGQVTGAGVFVALATMIGTWLWHTGGSAGSPLSISAVDYIQMAAWIPALVAAGTMAVAALIAWSHLTQGTGGAPSNNLRRNLFRVPHIAALLPVRPGEGWRARLIGVLVLSMVIIPAGVLGDMATVSVGRMLGVFGDTLFRPAVPLALAATLLCALVGFAFFPLLRRAGHFIEVNGLLLVGFVTGYVGLMFGSLTAIGSSPLSVPKLPGPWYAIILFPALMLWLSYRGHDARMWPLRSDGTPSVRSRLAAWLLPVLIGIAGVWTGHLLIRGRRSAARGEELRCSRARTRRRQVIAVTPERKVKRVHRLRFQRFSRRRQETFVVVVIIIFVLVALVVLLTLWKMPAANRQHADDGVRTVWTAPAAQLLVTRGQANRDRCALTQAAVQLPCSSSTIRRHENSPRPVPLSLVVKNGSKSLFWTSGAIPGPLSATLIVTSSPSSAVVIVSR